MPDPARSMASYNEDDEYDVDDDGMMMVVLL